MTTGSPWEFDVFVSYAHVDNEPIYPAELGWVSVLIDNLDRYLAKKIGRREAFSTWYDQRSLQGNHQIQNHIPDQAKKSAILLVVLSPGYAASDFCLRELQAFIDAHRGQITDRLFVVEHAPLGDAHEVPDALRDVRKYRFYKLDESQIPRTFALPKPLPDEREYFQKIDDLARDIAAKLTTAGPSKATGPAVFLAEVSDDLETRRDEVRRYLDQAGIDVLPASAYRLVRDEFERAMSGDFEQSALFVQLLSSIAGRRPPDVPDGFGWLQFEAAKRKSLPILQWRQPDLDLSSVELPLQRKLLEQVSVRAMPLEDFKRNIVETFQQMQQIKAKPAAPPPADVQPSMVFINADTVDKDNADRIKDALGDRFGWSMPLALEGQGATPAELQEDMESNVINSEGLFIVYGAARPAWVASQLQLYRKLAPRRTQKPRLLAIVDAPPAPKAPLSIGLPGLMRIDIDRIPEVVNSVLTA